MAQIVFEDEHLLVANKPAGVNTHSPGPFAGEGLYEWLKNREPRWADLAIIHRLDKETSGLIVFTKTPLANRSLTVQFEERAVHKTYVLLTDRPVPSDHLVAKSCLVRLSDKYVSRPPHAGGELAETHFHAEPQGSSPRQLKAEPLTGRTHQIRVHAADHGFPILGDTFYGGTPAPRVCLHAEQIRFKHPATGQEVVFSAPPDFNADPRLALREAFIDSEQTNAYRLIHGAADGWPGLYVERLGDYLLAQSETELTSAQQDLLARCQKQFSLRGVYHKVLRRYVQKAAVETASPRLILGEPAPDEFTILENGIHFALRFSEGYSVGLFLDQRSNRRRLLTRYVGPDFFLSTEPDSNLQPDELGHRRSGALLETPPLTGCEVLNAFAYTCGFSVCAAKAGARVTSLDLSKKYLEWGKRNFALNGIDPGQHDFIFGDAFDWLRRLTKKGRLFDVILLDPPTFSRSKERGVFQVEKHYCDLAAAALPLLKPQGVLFASTNAATLQPDDFLKSLDEAAHRTGRKILQQHYVPQPPDFPLHRNEPAYLKTVWMRMS